MSSTHFDLMNQLQSALLGANGGLEQLQRLRMAFPLSTGATHSARIRSIISTLPQGDQLMDTDPMILYSAFTELWELIVLTGEEVEAYEFDSVVDLKPLLGHLLRVLAWDEGCQVYGSEFLLYAIRCTRACVQYSPGNARSLAETGLVPLITSQLFSVEYIDLAEDSIQILNLLTKNSPAHCRACLQCDGIKAVLGFVDFLAISVQVNAFTAAAQMASALTDDTFDIYLPADLLVLLRSTIRRAEVETDTQTIKLIHQAAKILLSALTAAPKHAERIFPSDFVIETILPHLTTVLPADSASILLRLLKTSVKHQVFTTANSDLTSKFIKSLLSVSNEAVNEDALRIVIEIYCRNKAQKPLLQLIPICLKKRDHHDSHVATDVVQLQPPFEILFNFFLNSPSISLPLRHFTLLVLLLLDDIYVGTDDSSSSVSLEKMAILSKLLTELKDPISLVIGLEWFRILSIRSASSSEFLQIATRQGLPAELESLKTFKADEDSVTVDLKNWLKSRLDIVEIDEDIYSIYVRNLATSSLLNTFPNSTLDNNHQFTTIEEFLALLEKGFTFTEYEWLGDPETCLAKRLLSLLEQSTHSLDDSERFKPVCEAVYKALSRYNTIFTSVNIKSDPNNPFATLDILNRPMRVLLRSTADSSDKMFICDPMTQIGWLVRVAACTCEEERTNIIKYSGIIGTGDDNEIIEDASMEPPTGNQNKIHYLLIY